LWQVNDVHRTPEWHSFYFPGAHKDLSLDEHESPTRPKRRLAITDFPNDDYDSMPDLQSISSSDEDSAGCGGFHDEQDSTQSSDEGDDDYDEEYEDELRDLRRDAMELAHDIPGFFDHHAPIPDDVFAEERKSNPFLRLLGSLRGQLLVFFSLPSTPTYCSLRSYVLFKPEAQNSQDAALC
jgi:hypothetical protein